MVYIALTWTTSGNSSVPILVAETLYEDLTRLLNRLLIQEPSQARDLVG